MPELQTRRLGRTEMQVTALSLGCAPFGTPYHTDRDAIDGVRRAIEPVTHSQNGGRLSPDMRKQLATQIRELAELEAQREEVKQILQSVAQNPEILQGPSRQMERLTQKIVRLKAEIRRLEGLVQQEGRGN